MPLRGSAKWSAKLSNRITVGSEKGRQLMTDAVGHVFGLAQRKCSVQATISSLLNADASRTSYPYPKQSRGLLKVAAFPWFFEPGGSLRGSMRKLLHQVEVDCGEGVVSLTDPNAVGGCGRTGRRLQPCRQHLRMFAGSLSEDAELKTSG